MLLAILLQAAVPACPATPAPPPAVMAGWTTKSATAATAAGETPLTLDRGVQAKLLPAGTTRLIVRPGKLPTAGSSGGVFAFTVPTVGRYRVAAGAGAWLDVVRDGKALTSVTHAHGPACSGIRKMVDFDLRPGRHLLQVVNSPTPTIHLMVSRLN